MCVFTIGCHDVKGGSVNLSQWKRLHYVMEIYYLAKTYNRNRMGSFDSGMAASHLTMMTSTTIKCYSRPTFRRGASFMVLFWFLAPHNSISFSVGSFYSRPVHRPLPLPGDTSSSTKLPNDLRLLVVVEPSPFTYICGYSNRFQELFRHLHERQLAINTTNNADSTNVEVVTVEVVQDPALLPRKAFGFPIFYTRGFRCWFYKKMSLSWDWTYQVLRRIFFFRPNLIHVTSPGFFALPVLCYARIFQIATVLSYHTHIPAYLPSYIRPWLVPVVSPILWFWIRFTHALADLTLVTSRAIQQEFHSHRIGNVHVWQKGIDIDRFHPRHFSEAMRARMMNDIRWEGKPHSAMNTSHLTTLQTQKNQTIIPTRIGKGSESSLLLLYLGRLAVEKRIEKLRAVLQNVPSTRLCVVGTGPHETHLKSYFANTSTVFMGELHGEELSEAYASADVFVFPSDSETLGFVVLEAMASGLPVIAANAGGIPDIICENSTTGFLVDSDEEFVMHVKKLAQDDQLRRRISAAGRKAVENWTWNASMAHLCDEQYVLAHEHIQRRWQARLTRKFEKFTQRILEFFINQNS